MQINVYYGGRGLIEDSTLFVISKLTEVFEELRINVVCYKLYENKNEITALASSLKNADGVILAANIEWFGIGGLLHELLDSFWIYGDKAKIAKTVMMPVVIAHAQGEKEGELELIKAWELLGGKAINGISAYVTDQTAFETNINYVKIIEGKAEEMYRAVNQRLTTFPTSNHLLLQGQKVPGNIDLTPEESDQLSKYVSDDTYVKNQRQDIAELSEIFKGMMENNDKNDAEPEFVRNFRMNFKPFDSEFAAIYAFKFSDTGKTLLADISFNHLKLSYGETDKPCVQVTLTRGVMNKIVTGRQTFQGAFMTGDVVTKDFKNYRVLDQLFQFEQGI
ncbi:MAG: NAD(P)H-dependent oxidoreductase [Lachnospiraceae bacterium]|nr:NAD(P)H-dependent oxidoreductase [Lachnospiraceae bacterium]